MGNINNNIVTLNRIMMTLTFGEYSDYLLFHLSTAMMTAFQDSSHSLLSTFILESYFYLYSYSFLAQSALIMDL
jgi:hypothetical protein